MPFIEEILNNIGTIICDLQPLQVHTFYEAVGYMIQAQVVRACMCVYMHVCAHTYVCEHVCACTHSDKFVLCLSVVHVLSWR